LQIAPLVMLHSTLLHLALVCCGVAPCASSAIAGLTCLESLSLAGALRCALDVGIAVSALLRSHASCKQQQHACCAATRPLTAWGAEAAAAEPPH
jgi:hypothetical protein